MAVVYSPLSIYSSYIADHGGWMQPQITNIIHPIYYNSLYWGAGKITWQNVMKIIKMSIALLFTSLKVHGPISQNEIFYLNDVSSSKKFWFKISVKSIKPLGYMKAIMYIAIAHTLLCNILN